jgi:hypothetical protein
VQDISVVRYISTKVTENGNYLNVRARRLKAFKNHVRPGVQDFPGRMANAAEALAVDMAEY